MKLLYRGEKLDDEFLPDYVQRMSHNNGFLDVRRFKKALTKYYKVWAGGRPHRLRYQAVSRVSLELILERNIPHDEYQRFYNRKRGEWRNEPGLCRSCWDAKQYFRFYWWLRGYEQCHIHHEKLIYREVSCSDGRKAVSSSLIHLIVMKYSGADLCQKKIIDELDRSIFDQKIVSGIREYFEFDRNVLAASEVILRGIATGKLIGKRADEKLQIIARLLSRYVANKDFWLRILVLAVLARDRGLYLALPLSEIGREVIETCRYIICTDPKVGCLLEKIKDFKEFRQMEDISLQEFMCDDLILPGHIIIRIKWSLFTCRNMLIQSGRDHVNISPIWDHLPKIIDLSVNREF